MFTEGMLICLKEPRQLALSRTRVSPVGDAGVILIDINEIFEVVDYDLKIVLLPIYSVFVTNVDWEWFALRRYCSRCDKYIRNCGHTRKRLTSLLTKYTNTYRKKKSAAGNCIRCGAPCLPFKMCQMHRNKVQQYKLKWRASKKTIDLSTPGTTETPE